MKRSFRKKKNMSKRNGYRTGSNRTSGGPRGLNSSFRGGFPDRSRVKLVYTDTLNITSGVTPCVQIYRGNGPFDPDFTGTGSQPSYYDDWSLVYTMYRVWGSTLSISALASSATTSMRFVIGPRRVTTAPTTLLGLDGIASNQYISSGIVGPNGFTGIDFSSRPLGTSLIKRMSTPQFKGLPASLFPAAEDLASAVTTTPVDQWYWLIAAINLDGSTAASFKAVISIEYDVEFFGRIEDNLDLEMRLQRLTRQVTASNEMYRQRELRVRGLIGPSLSSDYKQVHDDDRPVLVDHFTGSDQSGRANEKSDELSPPQRSSQSEPPPRYTSVRLSATPYPLSTVRR